MKASPAQRTELLTVLDKEAKEYQKTKSDFDKEQMDKTKAENGIGNANLQKEKMPAHYFTMLKQLTLLGFFTSKPGATEALIYLPVPGRYDGAFPYKKGDKAWAE